MVDKQHKSEYMKLYRIKNKEKINDWKEKNGEHLKEYRKEYYQKNKEKILDGCKIPGKVYYEKNKEKIHQKRKGYDEIYYINNKTKRREYYIKNKEKIHKYMREKYNNDVKHKISNVLRVRMNDALKSPRKSHSIKYLGCSIKFYIQYLESQFTSEMSWDNYGKNKYWEIDHIKQLNTFDFNDEKNIYKAFHYTNTRPLLISENRSRLKN